MLLDVNELLLLGSIVIIACILCNRFTSRMGIPMLLAFILLGMIFGSEGLVRIRFDNMELAGATCTVALIFIMFYGGFGTRWKTAKPAAVKATLLSSIGTITTALLVGMFCHLALGFTFWEGMLTGSVLASTDAASVFSVLRSQKLSLKYNTDSLLELESGSNDPFAYMLTLIILSVMTGNVASENLPLQIAMTMFAQLFGGLLIGLAIAFSSRWFLEHFTFDINGFDAAFMLAVSLLAYALPCMIEGNGYLSTYLVGLILGNHPMRNKKSLFNFFDGFTSLCQMLIFFILGLLSYPSRIVASLFPAFAIALFLAFVARPLAVALLLAPQKAPLRQQILISWAGLRGAASIVFAITALLNDPGLNHDLFHIVFCVVLLSISIQGTLLPVVAEKIHMINHSGNVLTTFNDYMEETDISYINIPILEGNPWAKQLVRDLNLPPGTLLVFLRRAGKKIIPRGDTILGVGDFLVLSAASYTGEDDIRLKEITIDPGHRWFGKYLYELKLPKNSLVILIRRGGQTIIPDGQTQILNGDVIVLNTM